MSCWWNASGGQAHRAERRERGSQLLRTEHRALDLLRCALASEVSQHRRALVRTVGRCTRSARGRILQLCICIRPSWGGGGGVESHLCEVGCRLPTTSRNLTGGRHHRRRDDHSEAAIGRAPLPAPTTELHVSSSAVINSGVDRERVTTMGPLPVAYHPTCQQDAYRTYQLSRLAMRGAQQHRINHSVLTRCGHHPVFVPSPQGR